MLFAGLPKDQRTKMGITEVEVRALLVVKILARTREALTIPNLTCLHQIGNEKLNEIAEQEIVIVATIQMPSNAE